MFNTAFRQRGGASTHILDSIMNRGNPDLLIWRSPIVDFNTNSVLTVSQGEGAFFIKNGQVMAEFGPGRYELKTENYPILSSLQKMLSGGQSTFTAEIYFVRKAISKEVLWGTDSPIQVRDPVQGIHTSLFGRGSYKVVIDNPIRFINKLSGHVNDFSPEDLDKYFFNQFQGHIKTAIAKELSHSQEELLGICARLEEFASILTSKIAGVFAEYGLELVDFSISALDIPEDDPNRQLLEQAYARRRELNLLGNDYQLVKGMEIMKDIANNSSGNNLASAGAGIGVGLATAGMVAEMSKNLFAGNNPQQPGQGSTNPDPLARLATAKKMLDAGLISQSDYDNTKNTILNGLTQCP